MLDKFLSYIKNECSLLPEEIKCLIAVSGGMDSMVLLDLMSKSQISFGVVHVDHHTRAGKSTTDAQFVENYCQQRGIPYYQLNYVHQGGNFQSEARAFRYENMKALLQSENYDVLMTAHHMDDNIESSLMALGRSSGLNGVRGIQARYQSICRPLLWASKQLIKDYVIKHNIDHIHDESNDQDIYTRNHLRHHAIPALEAAIPDFSSKMNQSLHKLKEDYTLLMALLDSLELVQDSDSDYKKINLQKLSNYPQVTLLYHVLRPYGFHYDQIQQVLNSQTGALIYSDTHELLKDRNQLLIRERNAKAPSVMSIPIEESQEVIISGYKINIQTKTPILLRKWQTGDEVRLNNGFTKTVKKHLINKKINRWDKENVFVIEYQGQSVDILLPPSLRTFNHTQLGINISD